MKRLLAAVALCAACTTPTDPAPELDARRWSGMSVAWKADDYGCLTARWERFIDSASARGVPVSIGIIGSRYGRCATHERLDRAIDAGIVELFNHGWTHGIERDSAGRAVRTEFWNTPFVDQVTSLMATQRVARARGHELVAFGAPFNRIDGTTVDAMNAADPVLRLWIYGDASWTRGAVLRRTANLERATAVPDLATLQAGFDPDAAVLVLQVHPNGWKTDAAWAEWSAALDWLATYSVTFVPMSKVR